VATGAFGLDLLRTQPAGNTVLSPDSVAAALAMAGTGAAGRTATQMASTLRLRDSDAFNAIGDLQRTIASELASAEQSHPKAPTLGVANGLFVQEGFALRPAFLSGLQQHFGTTPEAVDFQHDSTAAVQRINEWVGGRTNGLIPQLLESLSASTRLALSNAVYLKAEWLHRFDPADTAPAPFHNRAESLTTPFMHETALLRYASGRGYEAVELPYRGSTLSLLVVLPRSMNLAGLERRLAVSGLDRLANGLSPEQVELSMPRFHLDTQTMLKGSLTKLGMTLAFSEAAEFPRMAKKQLELETVTHAADLTVDETGTEAAAATVVTVGLRARPPRGAPFDANHPFLFFLRDHRTGAVLFAGRLTDPTSVSP
jgi:serine protease inhibitor